MNYEFKLGSIMNTYYTRISVTNENECGYFPSLVTELFTYDDGDNETVVFTMSSNIIDPNILYDDECYDAFDSMSAAMEAMYGYILKTNEDDELFFKYIYEEPYCLCPRVLIIDKAKRIGGDETKGNKLILQAIEETLKAFGCDGAFLKAGDIIKHTDDDVDHTDKIVQYYKSLDNMNMVSEKDNIFYIPSMDIDE